VSGPISHQGLSDRDLCSAHRNVYTSMTGLTKFCASNDAVASQILNKCTSFRRRLPVALHVSSDHRDQRVRFAAFLCLPEFSIKFSIFLLKSAGGLIRMGLQDAMDRPSVRRVGTQESLAQAISFRRASGSIALMPHGSPIPVGEGLQSLLLL
jgi:hypothetical protein